MLWPRVLWICRGVWTCPVLNLSSLILHMRLQVGMDCGYLGHAALRGNDGSLARGSTCCRPADRIG